MRARVGLLAALAGALAAQGCSGDPECASRAVTSDTECNLSQDCADKGYQGLTCLDGRCQKPCRIDGECVPPSLGDDESPECVALSANPPAAICEGQVCVLGCPDVACGAGESCVEGRCVFFSEGFEAAEGASFVNLELLGWNDLPTELKNPRTKVAYKGLRGCTLGDESCAGVAAEGERFLALERQPTQPKGTAKSGFTCRACACCLACIFQPADAGAVDLAECPCILASGDDTATRDYCPGDRPNPTSCPSAPARCDAVCQQCAACPAADPARLGPGLTSCEQSAAERTCSNCPTCETEREACRASQCPVCATNPTGAECVSCQQQNCQFASCDACEACSAAQAALLSDPGSATTLALVAQCEAQGPDGCFETAVAFDRSELTDLEQAAVSPEINLSGVTGKVVLQLDHVPFNVGESYRPGIQGQDPSTWPLAPQGVRVELCGGACEMPSSWTLGTLSSGGEAILPAANRRRNGLLLGSQAALDWQAGRAEVQIPEGLRTSQLRLRFVPEIDAGTRLGIDRVVVRRVP